MQNQFVFLFSYWIKAFFLLIIYEVSAQWKLEIPQGVFYLKTKTICVLKHFLIVLVCSELLLLCHITLKVYYFSFFSIAKSIFKSSETKSPG